MSQATSFLWLTNIALYTSIRYIANRFSAWRQSRANRFLANRLLAAVITA